MSDVHHLRAVLTGRVQGVGFRHFVWREASRLGLDGEVRNRADGSIEIHAWGPRGELDRLLESAQRGPASAQVTDSDARFDDAPCRQRGFHITG